MAEEARRAWRQAEWLECRRTIRHLELGLAGLRLAAFAVAAVAVPGLALPGAEMATAGLFLGWAGAVLLVAGAAVLDLHLSHQRDAAWLRAVRLEIEGLGLLGTGLSTETLGMSGGGWPRHAYAGYSLSVAVATAGFLMRPGSDPFLAVLTGALAGGIALAILYPGARMALAVVRRERLRLREIVRAEPFFGADEIAAAVTAVAAEIKAWLAAEPASARPGPAEPLILVSIRQGARYFVADLVPRLSQAVPVRVVPVRVASAPGVAQRTVPLLEYGPLDPEVFRGRQVLIVDDILDTGETLRFVREEVARLGPASIRTAVFLKKFQDVGVPVDFVAYDLGIRPDSPARRYWFFGYGMDADGDFRDLPVVGAVDSESFRQVMDKAR